MRSRYSAYVMGDIAYLLLTWHSSTRPPAIDPDTIPDWCGLDIIRTDKGQVDDDEGIVEFKATALSHGRILTLHEVSRFVKEGGQWLYVSGDMRGDSQQVGSKTNAVVPKAGTGTVTISFGVDKSPVILATCSVGTSW